MASNLEPKINRIATAVTSALSALTAKGVTVPEGANVESLAALIESIEAGGGIPGYQIVSGTYSPSEDITSTIYVYRTKKLGITSSSVSNINKRCVAITFLDISLTDEIIYPTAGFNAYVLGKGLNYNYSSSSSGSEKLISNALHGHKIGTNSYGMEVRLACNGSYPLKAGNTYRWVLLAPDDISIESI